MLANITLELFLSQCNVEIMQEILNLLSPSYLFRWNLGPFTTNPVWYFIGILVGLMVFAYFNLKLAEKKDIFTKKVAIKFLAFAWSISISGIILVLFRQVNATYISAPVILLVWLGIAIVWFAHVAFYKLKTIPNRRKELKQEAGKRNYIP